MFQKFQVVAQMPCNVPNEGSLGTCITFRKCQHIVNLVIQQSSNPKPEITEYVQKSFCGFDKSEPKVCCPKTGNKKNTTTKSTESSGIIPYQIIFAQLSPSTTPSTVALFTFASLSGYFPQSPTLNQLTPLQQDGCGITNATRQVQVFWKNFF